MPIKWNDTRVDHPPGQCVHQLFETQVERAPDATAVLFEDEQLSYEELNRRANQLAYHLRALGVGPEVLVGICMDRSLDMIVALMGVLKAGGAYLPLDPAYPQSRLDFMLGDAQVAVLLIHREQVGKLANHKARFILLGAHWEVIATQWDRNVDSGVAADNLAYVIYTSGSTGRPKGVMIQHRSLANYTQAAGLEFGLAPGDRVLQFASISFDTSAEEIFPCLTRGATLVLRPDSMIATMSFFLAQCRDLEITVLDLPTAYWHELSARLGSGALAFPSCVRLVIIGGEKALPERLAAWRQYVDPKIRLLNTYGPTEATIVTTMWDFGRAKAEKGSLQEMPIGSPIQNAHTYVLDQHLRPVPEGTPGELYIGGSGLARGYLNRPGLTAEAFIPNPYRAGSRLYKTGDIVSLLPDGNLEFVGRLDRQVKTRGFRVELGEVETALRRHPAVQETVVVARDGRLVAYVVLEKEQPAITGELHRFLKKELPDYMLPSAFVTLEALPLSSSGKIDRNALPPPPRVRPPLEGVYVAPRSALERLLVAMWQDVLGVEDIGVHDNFFELGGDSIRAAIFINMIQERLEEIVHVVALFDTPTISELADYFGKQYPRATARILGLELDQEATPPKKSIDAVRVDQFRQCLPSLPALDPHAMTTPKNPPAIFILSPPRCGSTLLRVILGGHPLLFAPPELELLSFDTLEERKAALSGRDSLALEGVLRAIMQIKGSDVERARRIMQDCEDQGLSTQRFYYLMQQWLEGKTLVDKSTVYALDLETLRRAEIYFENPLYIHLLRHPYGMIRSFERTRLDQIFFSQKLPFSRRELAELVWLVGHENILEFLRRVPAHRQYRIRFEDLVENPRSTVKSMCWFLGVDFDPHMLQPYREKKKRMTDGLYPVSRMIGDPTFHKHSKIEAEVADSWKKDYTLDFLGDLTWQLAESLGYERIRAEQRVGRVEAIGKVDRGEAEQLLAQLDQLSDVRVTSLLKDRLAKKEKDLNEQALRS